VVAPVWAEGTGRPGSALEGLAAPSAGAFARAVVAVESRAFVTGEGRRILVPAADQVFSRLLPASPAVGEGWTQVA